MNDRLITDGLSLLHRARWVISPLGLRRDRPWRAIQSTISPVSWSCCASQSSLDHSGWWRLKSPVSIVGRWEMIPSVLCSLFRIHSSPLGVSLYTLVILTIGWLPCITSSIWISLCSRISDLNVSVKSFLGL